MARSAFHSPWRAAHHLELIMTNRMNHAWTAGALAICSIAGSAPALAHDGSEGTRECYMRTLTGSYVLAASGFAFAGTVTTPKALVEEIDFDGQGGGSSPGGAAVALNGNPALVPGSNSGVKYEFVPGQRCVFKVTFASGPIHAIFMAPDGDSGWTLQLNSNNAFQGTLTRVWPSKDHDERR
jgi:hypothetical protein